MAYIGYGSALSLTLFLIVLVPIYGFSGAAIAIMINNILVFWVSSKYSKKYFDNNIVFGLLIKLMSSFIVLIAFNYLISEVEASLLWHLGTKFGIVGVYIILVSFIIWKIES